MTSDVYFIYFLTRGSWQSKRFIFTYFFLFTQDSVQLFQAATNTTRHYESVTSCGRYSTTLETAKAVQCPESRAHPSGQWRHEEGRRDEHAVYAQGHADLHVQLRQIRVGTTLIMHTKYIHMISLSKRLISKNKHWYFKSRTLSFIHTLELNIFDWRLYCYGCLMWTRKGRLTCMLANKLKQTQSTLKVILNQRTHTKQSILLTKFILDWKY